MAVFLADPELTLKEARELYFQLNGFGDDGGYEGEWVDFKFGPIPFPFPNYAGHVRSVRLHDLHHALTGYGTDTLGELEMSAWEIGSGCADHHVAWVYNVMGLAAGTLLIPRWTWRAFFHGRQCGNLYRERFDEKLLSRKVGEVRAALGIDQVGHRGVRASDVAMFTASALAGLVTGTAGTALVFVPLSLYAAVSKHILGKPLTKVARSTAATP